MMKELKEMEKLSAAMEDYLKTIYHLSSCNSAIYIREIARQMRVSKASVCRATDFLCRKGLIVKNKYQDLSLTEEGYKQAALLSRKNSILQKFLSEILHIDPNVADKDACSIEHGISLESFQSICRYLESRGITLN